ncbi:MAG: Flp pilus assembly complex ATPase component TadA [Armatimonadetes bacterium]|nr:Flp pilus assembly complex ATPase component TadA [Armatimonadota bacterium]
MVNGAKQRLGELLVSQKLITQDELNTALEIQLETSAALGGILISLGFISEDMLLRVLAAQMGVSPWNLAKEPPHESVLQLLKKEVCETHQMLPVREQGELLTLAMRNPLDVEAIDLARNLTKKRIVPVLANPERLAKAIEENIIDAKQSQMDTLVDQAIKEHGDHKPKKREKQILTEADTRPVIAVVNQILTQAIRLGASDIHIEPRGNRLEVRFRVDGHLRKVRDFPLDVMPMLTARLKIMSELDIVETRLPQDGRTTVGVDGRNVDMRVSVVPNYNGQRVVLRLLDRASQLHKMEALGFSPLQLSMFRGLIERPYGMILVTGPTGSGKTTTLYAALNEIKDITSNIMTAEDPVEFDIDGISQSQVNEKIGLTFPTVLRSILRQDPDVIFVGEIRDKETAETAIRASLTGHLVLSTLHCNDAPGAIPRLLDMGVEPYLLSTSLIGVTAQRLLRKICPHCKEEAPDSFVLNAMASGFGLEADKQWRGKGCPKCQHTGYKGRIAVQEILPIMPDVAEAIAEHKALDTVKFLGAKAGYEPLQLDAMRRVIEGVTTLDEARRQVAFAQAGIETPFLKLAA